jgi:hypothetical protein
MSGLEKGQDQSVDFILPDSPANAVHQAVVRDIIKATFDIALDGYLIREPWDLPGRRFPGFLGSEAFPQMFQGSVYASTRSKPIRSGIEIRFKDRLQDVSQGRLNHPDFHSRDAQGGKLPWFPGFGNHYPSYRVGSKGSASQFGPELL